MKKDDILQLGRLSRLDLSEEEVEVFGKEIDSILKYVSTINSLVTDDVTDKSVGSVHNVFRADEVKNEPGEYKERLLKEMPDKKGDFLRVKKILHTGD